MGTEQENEKIFKLPKEVTKTFYACIALGECHGGRLEISEYNKETLYADEPHRGWRMIKSIEVTIPLPELEYDLRSELISALEAKQKRLMAENHMAMQEIMEKLQKLKCIEYMPAAPAPEVQF